MRMTSQDGGHREAYERDHPRGGPAHHSMVSSDVKPVGGTDVPPVHAVADSLWFSDSSASSTHLRSVGSSEVAGVTSNASLPAGSLRTRTVSLPPPAPRQCSMRVRTGATRSSTWLGWQPSVSVTRRRHRGAGRGGPSAAAGAGAAARGASPAARGARGAPSSPAAVVLAIGGDAGGGGAPHAQSTKTPASATCPVEMRIMRRSAATAIPRERPLGAPSAAP